ncbi:DUF5763 domain-containing protein [Pedobacter sp. ASV12]|uniref:DUF5763 domain-containing protein n=1 Tax=Pedobacter sp. ASV12 TaxID=2795120 RepID=UPI00351C29D0
MLIYFSLNSTKKTSVSTVATCYGNTPCNACTNCSRCRYCGNGGSCGVCKPKSTAQLLPSNRASTTGKAKTSVYAGQCKALTKKGARCKRSAGSGGYCWQHGK